MQMTFANNTMAIDMFLFLIVIATHGVVRCQYPWYNNYGNPQWPQPAWGTSGSQQRYDGRQSWNYGYRRQYPPPTLTPDRNGGSSGNFRRWGSNPSNSEQWQRPWYQSGRNLPSNDIRGSASNRFSSRFFGSSVNDRIFDDTGSIPNGAASTCGLSTYKQFIQSCLNYNSSRLLEMDVSFPVDAHRVNETCNLWSSFFTCIRRKITGCSNRKNFTKGLEKSISSLQKMCTDKKYQKSYLLQARCMKSVVQKYCPNPYNNLIARIKSKDTDIQHYCCDGHVLKMCALSPLKLECTGLAEEILVTTLNFLTKCDDRPSVPCPPVNGQKGSGADPRTVDKGSRRGGGGGGGGGGAYDVTGTRDNRADDRPTIDIPKRLQPWRPGPTPFWPKNIQPAQQKSQRSGGISMHSSAKVYLIFSLPIIFLINA